MADTTKPYASSFQLKTVVIYGVKSNKAYDITDLVQRFDYFESITSPMISGTLVMVDSGSNLISSLPIQGTERIVITLIAPNNEEHEYDLRVFKIGNRFGAERFQTYTLGLVSWEGLLNEGVRITKVLKGKSSEIVRSLLKDYLKTTKDINFETTKFNIIFNAGKKNPFAVINSIQSKSVANSSSNTITDAPKATGSTTSSSNSTISSLKPTDSSEYGSVTGSAGYLFFENKDGYVFKSIDSLCEGKTSVGTYYQEPIDINSPPNKKILSIDFINEIDILTKLRTGAFSSVICYYNYSTGAYEEYVHSLDKSYDSMKHMGSQKGLPYGQKELSKYPTRVMSMILDHETWYDGEAIASPEKKDGGAGGDNAAEFPDYQKFYIAQSISRLNSLTNQKVQIKINGTPSIKAGDSINIMIPNQVTQKQKIVEKYDPEHSGTYLISEVNHVFESKLRTCFTFLTLIRDSYGMKNYASKTQ
jgi:hypothetical protein